MKYSDLLEQLRMIRKLYCMDIKAYVLSKGGVVECSQTEREYPSYSDKKYLRRVKFKTLHIEDNRLIVDYFVCNTKFDKDWEEHKYPIEYLGWNDLVHITEDIISKGVNR